MISYKKRNFLRYRLLSILLIVPIFAGVLLAESDPFFTDLSSNTNLNFVYAGSLEDGKILESLDWAASSQVACFPGTQNLKFRGKHRLFRIQLEPYTEVLITLIPKDTKNRFSLYAYQVGSNDRTSIVPALHSAVSCEADYRFDRPVKGRTQDHTRHVKLLGLKNPYAIFVGVAGEKDVVQGEFRLEFRKKRLR